MQLLHIFRNWVSKMIIQFNLNLEGIPSKKQLESLNIVVTLVTAFYTEEDGKQPRTWGFLLEALTKKLGKPKTQPQKKTLHKYLVELIRQGIVRGEVKAVDNRLVTFFEYTEALFHLKGKKRLSIKPATKRDGDISISGYLVRRHPKTAVSKTERENWCFIPSERSHVEHWLKGLEVLHDVISQ